MQENSVTKNCQSTDPLRDHESTTMNTTAATPKLQISELLLRLGEFGRFHYIALTACVLVSIATSAGSMALPFVMKDPTFRCTDEAGRAYECSQVHACASPRGYELQYDIKSLVVAHGLYCERRWLKIWGQSALFIFSSLASTLAMFLLERFGRRAIFLFVAAGTFICNVLLLFDWGYWSTLTVLTASYALAFLYFTNFYVYSTELFNGKWRSVANSCFFLANYAIKICYVMLNLGIKTYYGNYVLMGALGLLFLPLAYFLVETPYYLHKKGDLESLKRNLEHINRVNCGGDIKRVADNDRLIAKSLQVETVTAEALANMSALKVTAKAKKSIFSEKFPLGSYATHIAMIIATIVPNYVGAALGDTIPYKLGINNIYVSAAAFVCVIMLTNLLLAFCLHKIPRRNGNIVAALFMLLFSLIFVLFAVLGVQHTALARGVELALTLVASGIGMMQFLLISRYVNEVFPTKIRAVSIALVLEIGRTSMFLANIIDPLSERLDVHPFAFIGVLYFFSLPFYLRYEETLDKPTKN